MSRTVVLFLLEDLFGIPSCGARQDGLIPGKSLGSYSLSIWFIRAPNKRDRLQEPCLGRYQGAFREHNPFWSSCPQVACAPAVGDYRVDSARC
ncbi:hypothetical protein AAMO2058_000019700 [Amorphochlora amoebiformis]